MKLENGEIMAIFFVIEAIGAEKFSVKFSYALAINREVLRSRVVALQKAGASSKEFLEYEQKRVALAREMAQRDEDGNLMSDGSDYIMADDEVFDKRWGELKEEYRNVIELREKEKKDFEALLEEESEVEGLEMLDFDKLPEDTTISPNHVAVLMPLSNKKLPGNTK